MRIGLGYDLHRLEERRPLILAGVPIPFEKGLYGHSDADALAHAVTDALLGAAALGDIGSHFPDTDPKYKGADSMALLTEAYGRVRAAGWVLGNLDATIIAQQPKMSPHIPAMRQSLADCLGVDAAAVSIKAKTNERLGPEGRGEAISVHAAVLIEHAP